jgi:hypothetical protein
MIACYGVRMKSAHRLAIDPLLVAGSESALYFALGWGPSSSWSDLRPCNLGRPVREVV